MGILSGACFILLVLFICRFRHKIIDRCRLIYYLSFIHGPFSIPILGSTWMMKWRMKKLMEQILEWVKYYMELKVDLVCFWVGPIPIVAAFSAESVKAILDSNVVITKGDEYNILKRWLGDGLLISKGEKWRKRRKLLTPSFHFNILQRFQSVFDKEAQVFLNQIERFAGTEEVFDIYPFVKRCALDIICETSMGVKVNAQTNHKHPYVLAVKRLNRLSFTYGRMPWLWIKPIWRFTGYEFKYEFNLKLVTDFTKKVISDRRKEFESGMNELADGERYAFLDLLLSVEKENALSNEDIREEVETIMFEGHDTTSSGLGWTLWSLANHPEYQIRVINEIDTIFGDSDRACTVDDLKEMRYLEMIIKESHRLFSPVPLLFRKVERDFECVGKKIPKGATLLVAPALVHLSSDHYETPLSFNPDHFETESILRRHPFAYVPFSAGPRNCIGQKFAFQEEKTVLSWFFRHFSIESTMPFFKNYPLPEIILKPSQGFPVKISRRVR